MKAPEPELKPTQRALNRKRGSEVAAATDQLPSATKVAGKPGFRTLPL